MNTAGAVAVTLTSVAGTVLGLRIYIHRRMAQSFALGMKIGAVVRSKGQTIIDEQLRSAGVDPEQLP